jgi:hypothetical protein
MGEADHVPTHFRSPDCAREQEQLASRPKTTQKGQRNQATCLLIRCSPFTMCPARFASRDPPMMDPTRKPMFERASVTVPSTREVSSTLTPERNVHLRANWRSVSNNRSPNGKEVRINYQMRAVERSCEPQIKLCYDCYRGFVGFSDSPALEREYSTFGGNDRVNLAYDNRYPLKFTQLGREIARAVFSVHFPESKYRR